MVHITLCNNHISLIDKIYLSFSELFYNFSIIVRIRLVVVVRWFIKCVASEKINGIKAQKTSTLHVEISRPRKQILSTYRIYNVVSTERLVHVKPAPFFVLSLYNVALSLPIFSFE